jgi:hypothetical protein
LLISLLLLTTTTTTTTTTAAAAATATVTPNYRALCPRDKGKSFPYDSLHNSFII